MPGTMWASSPTKYRMLIIKNYYKFYAKDKIKRKIIYFRRFLKWEKL